MNPIKDIMALKAGETLEFPIEVQGTGPYMFGAGATGEE